MKKKVISILLLISIVINTTGCSLYDDLVRDKRQPAFKYSDNDNEYEQSNEVTVDGKFVYDNIVSWAKAQIPYETYFLPYEETAFPDYLELEPCNTKIKQGVYANYETYMYGGIDYYYTDALGQTSGRISWISVYYKVEGTNVTILAIDASI